MIKHSFFIILISLMIPFSGWSQSNEDIQLNRSKASLSMAKPTAAVAAISVFPNPVQDILKFENPTGIKIKEIMIVNHVGRFISQIDVDRKSSEIDVKNLKRGIYRLIVISKEGLKLSQSFVKE